MQTPVTIVKSSDFSMLTSERIVYLFAVKGCRLQIKAFIERISIFKVLMGDLKPAIETHEMLYEVAKRHKFIPEVVLTVLSCLHINSYTIFSKQRRKQSPVDLPISLNSICR